MNAIKGVIKATVADGVITFMWVFAVAALGAATSATASALQVHEIAPTLLITTLFIFALLFIFGVFSDALGGASFNPTAIAAFYAAGLTNDSILSMALRFPAQALGAVFGVLAMDEVMPLKYIHTMSGPSLKVDLHVGAVAEGVLTFLITLAVLWIIVKGPRSSIVKSLLISIATVVLVIAGSEYTGPSMNPANAFGWAFFTNNHNTWEQFYVYWICPFIGAILAAWVFRFIFPPQPAKVKEA